MPEVSLQRYSPEHKSEWNNFVATSKNGTFLFDRSYMDYHSDRFKDHSLILRKVEKVCGVFVANEKDALIESHGGLTYGGLILETDARLAGVIQMLQEVAEYYRKSGFKKIIYKCVPTYLHTYSANEDQFALFALGAKLVRRDTSSVIVNERSLISREEPERDFEITESKDCKRFWEEVLLPQLRKRYNTDPVHTSNEMNMLMSRFPENIKVYEIGNPEILAGTVVYFYPNCVHTQYLSSTPKGRQLGALDFLIDHLIAEFSDKKYFSLGTSNNEGGPQLNTGLLAWKEGFGARTFVQDFYEIDLK